MQIFSQTLYRLIPIKETVLKFFSQEWFFSLSQFGTAERESFESVRDRGARIIWVRSGPRSANHLSQIGTAERESFESVRDRGARIIWVSSGPRSANHLSQIGTAERESRITACFDILWFNALAFLCMCLMSRCMWTNTVVSLYFLLQML